MANKIYAVVEYALLDEGIIVLSTYTCIEPVFLSFEEARSHLLEARRDFVMKTVHQFAYAASWFEAKTKSSLTHINEWIKTKISKDMNLQDIKYLMGEELISIYDKFKNLNKEELDSFFEMVIPDIFEILQFEIGNVLLL